MGAEAGAMSYVLRDAWGHQELCEAGGTLPRPCGRSTAHILTSDFWCPQLTVRE